MAGSKSLTPLSKINADLITYDMNKSNKKVYMFQCERCGKEFKFQMKDVKNRVLVCPECNFDNVFFAYEFL